MIQSLKRLKWNIGLIQRVEILKMASEMAPSKAPKTYIYLTNKPFLCMFEGLMIQTIKMKYWFSSED